MQATPFTQMKRNRGSTTVPYGGDNEIRTRGLLVANEALYQLSHIPKALNHYTVSCAVCQMFFRSLLKIFVL